MTVAPSWVTKLPDDMTLDELQSAKATMEAALEEVRVELEWRVTALNFVTARVQERFGLSLGGYPPRTQLTDYPSDQVLAEWGPDGD